MSSRGDVELRARNSSFGDWRQEELLMHISILRQAVGARAPRSRAAVPILNVIDDFNSGSLAAVPEFSLAGAAGGPRAQACRGDPR
jgi:hypothetical protein